MWGGRGRSALGAGPTVEPVGEGSGERDRRRVGGEAAALEEEDAGGDRADEAGVVRGEEDEAAVGRHGPVCQQGFCSPDSAQGRQLHRQRGC